MTRDALASIAVHTPCRETCACWARGATDEAKLRQPRPGIRQLAGYIRAVSDSEPGLSDEGMARRVAAVFIPATLDATRKLADPLWRVAEAAREAWAAAEFADGGFDGECVDYLVPIPAMDALREALAALDANVEEMP